MLSDDLIKKSDAVITRDAKLSRFTTFQLGGRCPLLIECGHPEQLETISQALYRQKQKFIVIGLGSNILISDQGIDCAVIRYLSRSPLIERSQTSLIVAASTSADDLANYAAYASMDGLGFLSGIPGTVGGAIVGNAGAYGRQISEVIENITIMDQSGKLVKAQSATLGFSYRSSLLQLTGETVISARVKVRNGNRGRLLDERKAILEQRKEKHPDWKKIPTAGSFFKNIELKDSPDQKSQRKSAGPYLEKAGVREFKVNGAAVFDKHANIIVKNGRCSAQDVYDLSVMMRKAVQNKFKIELKREVRLAGSFNASEASGKRIFW